MAFAIRNLSVLAYAKSFTLWHYKSGQDDLAAINGGNYFRDIADMLSAGDMLIVVANGEARIAVVAVAAPETVILAPLS